MGVLGAIGHQLPVEVRLVQVRPRTTVSMLCLKSHLPFTKLVQLTLSILLHESLVDHLLKVRVVI